MAANIREFLSGNPIELAGRGFECLKDAQTTIDRLRAAALISVGIIKVTWGPLWIVHKGFGKIIRVNHHACAIVRTTNDTWLCIDPHAPDDMAVSETEDPTLQN